MIRVCVDIFFTLTALCFYEWRVYKVCLVLLFSTQSSETVKLNKIGEEDN